MTVIPAQPTPDQPGYGYLSGLTEDQRAALEGVRIRADREVRKAAESDPNAPLPTEATNPTFVPSPGMAARNTARRQIATTKAAERRDQRQRVARRQAGIKTHRKAVPTRRKKAS